MADEYEELNTDLLGHDPTVMDRRSTSAKSLPQVEWLDEPIPVPRPERERGDRFTIGDTTSDLLSLPVGTVIVVDRWDDVHCLVIENTGTDMTFLSLYDGVSKIDYETARFLHFSKVRVVYTVDVHDWTYEKRKAEGLTPAPSECSLEP